MAVVGLRHIGLKILSIALAALLWLLVSGEQVVERSMRVPLEFTNVPANIELVTESPPIDVRVRGSSGALGRIAAGELVAVLDLKDAKAPLRVFHLTASDVKRPFGVEVVQVSPSSVTIHFEQSKPKTVPIVPAVEGAPAPGFIIGTRSAEPAKVDLVGTESALQGVRNATTDPVSVDGATSDVTRTVTVGSTDPNVRLSKPQSARVTVKIVPEPTSWSVPGVRVKPRNAGRATTIAPEVVTVFAAGPYDAQGTADDFEASVDVAGLASGRHDLPVRVVPPPKVRVVRIEPERVRVTIR